MRRIGFAIVIAALLAGCMGRGMQSLPPGNAAGANTPLALQLLVPAPSASSGIRPMYVSRNTKGLGISYGAHPATFPPVTMPSSAYDVSPSSSLCVVNSDGSRTCTLSLAAPPGSDDFQVIAWDAVPVSGSFASANRLSGTTVTKTINAGQANSLSFVLDGVVNGVGLFVSASSLPAAASSSPSQTATLFVNATDLYGNIIIGSGNYADASGNPLTFSIAQSTTVSGDTLRTSLSGNTITSASANTLTVTYSGNSSYGAKFTATPSVPIAGTVGTAALSISPWLISEFALSPGCGPVGLIVGPDHNLWFAESDGDRVGRVTPTGTVTEYAVASGAGPLGITAGPDGKLWFTEANSSRIGRINTDGTGYTEFSAGITSGSSPQFITAGPDGNLWFTEAADRIAKITTAGVVTEYTSGITAGSSPIGIAVGGDGNIWFTEYIAGAIGKFVPGGTSATEFTTGIPVGAFPIGIVAAPSGGSMFFTENGVDAIGKITTSGGVVTQFTDGISPAAEPFGITTGPDGNLWFTECCGNRIGRMTTAGVVTEFSNGLTANSSPSGITAGPDGNIWFTEEDGNNVGRLIY
ncbi:MAG TPA: hypothetical protein VFO29_05665 [Candidatus Rubrimentiphilum sp.]|nr:hypothetical protein [Candidatus Rubrimentiphilum sp.]